MPFAPDKITKQHILDAVNKIESENIVLEPSTRFDVIINSKAYPPKEVMRYAHELMNGEHIWERGGGEPTNKYFIALGFEIKSKSDFDLTEKVITGNIWKLGCNWGTGKPSFYNYIRKEEIVIGVDDKMYNVGDLVIVTEGHLVKAIARINEIPKPVKSNILLEESFNNLEIEYNTWVNYANAEWYELAESDTFAYQLQQGICQVQNLEIRKKVFDIWNSRYLKNVSKESTNQKDMQPKNIILYGPPGTGKTYNSIDKAVEIAAPDGFTSNKHTENKTIFDELRKVGQIEFITFHQNYSYEDFVLGIRPNVEEENNTLSFKKHYGIFYHIADRAKENYLSSLEEKGKLISVQELINDLLEKLRNGEKIDLKTPTNVPFSIKYLTEQSIQLIYSNGSLNNTLSIDTLIGIAEGKRDYTASLRSYYYPLKDYLVSKRIDDKKAKEELKNYVLVIDEINRANISKVFGELITLLEDDKRLGEENELKITLPNGEKEFGVPPNLYIIGTMNTADKSIALIDIALRRRFEFIGYYPEYKQLNEEGSLLLKIINEAVFREKKSADYLIGHAYFMKGQAIQIVLRNKVVPLLMEYFSGKTEIVSKIFADTNWDVTYDKINFIWNISPR